MKLRCVFGHDWKYHPGETRYSTAGILAGHVELAERACQRCSKTESVYRSGSLARFLLDDTGWLVVTPDKQPIIHGYYLSLKELTERNRKRALEKASK